MTDENFKVASIEAARGLIEDHGDGRFTLYIDGVVLPVQAVQIAPHETLVSKDAYAALERLVLSEFPSGETIASIAKTWGSEFLTKEQIEALQ